MCVCRQIHYKQCDHLKKEWSHCRKYVAEAGKLRYKIFPCFFALACPSTTTYMGWEDQGLCARCLSVERIKDWLCYPGGAPEQKPLQESVVLPDGGGYPAAMPKMVPENQQRMSGTSTLGRASSSTMTQGEQKLSDPSESSRTSFSTMSQGEQQLFGPPSSGRTSMATEGFNVYGEPKRYTWLDLKPLPLVPGTAQVSPSSSTEDGSVYGKKTSQDDVWPEGMSTEEYMEEVEMLWQRAGTQPARK
ncbi:hypothetical protein F5X68DRAFT_230751 [Plectosphaerella plurivora]|uniref:Uncharacterized protein n=1 Tax=Plectosphaerella plurivora TaxID=936078 RepID=A0A9P8VE82_9PEZI|nr:hypothetical protein F5X68DRAFT_230751 [Plectosphaerella plurivora]